MDHEIPPASRSWAKTVLHVLRRTHLYAGLFLLPWAVLYGVTAFLFNHPTAFSDQPAAHFGREALADTPMESTPDPAAVAEQVVASLRARTSGSTYTLVEPAEAKYTREFAFAIIRAEGRETNVLIDVSGAGGSIRSREFPTPKPEEPAPFAVGGSRPAGPGRAGPPAERLDLPDPLSDRVKATVPTIVERTGFVGGEVIVTSVPDLSFLMDADGRRWRVAYNDLSGSVSGWPVDAETPPSPLSTRGFLLQLHSAHGYPYRPDGRWAWAVLVDAMAAVLVFWAASGLVMWWQVKAARRVGAVVLLVSAAVVVVLVAAMRSVLAG